MRLPYGSRTEISMEILIPALVLLAIAALCAVLLVVSSSLFGVAVDERLAKIREELPGANCGACGFSGCDGYAKALVEGQTDNPSLCTPGGDGVSERVAEIMELQPSDIKEMVAYVACAGPGLADDKKYEYSGPKSCVIASMSYAGDRSCHYACLGYGDCVNVCPREAIKIGERGVAEIDPKKCIGCGLCVKTCPKGVISLIEDTARFVIKCSNHDKGAAVMKVCKNGCIACGKCAKTCPHGAISIVDNLAVIDYSKCTACGECHKVCPTGCIHAGNFICGSHFE